MRILSQWTVIVCILLLIVSQNELKAHYQDTGKEEATIVISEDVLICNSNFTHKYDSWPVRYTKPLKVGSNEYYFVPFEGMSVKVEIIKYK